MNQRKWELHILKGVNVSNHGAERMFEDSSDLLLFAFLAVRLFFCGAELHVSAGESSEEIYRLRTCIYLPAVSSLPRR